MGDHDNPQTFEDLKLCSLFFSPLPFQQSKRDGGRSQTIFIPLSFFRLFRNQCGIDKDNRRYVNPSPSLDRSPHPGIHLQLGWRSLTAQPEHPSLSFCSRISRLARRIPNLTI